MIGGLPGTQEGDVLIDRTFPVSCIDSTRELVVVKGAAYQTCTS